MSTNTILKALRGLSVGTGLSLAFVSQIQLGADLLSGQGSSLMPSPLAAPALHDAAPAAFASGPMQLVLGVAFIVIGFFLHALIGVREERAVHITVVPKKKIREQKWFWMEIRI